MLHGYKKSRYNIYDNLEFLGLNPYEQKHFCFGEGEGNDSSGGVDEGAPTSQAAQDEANEAAGMSRGDSLDPDSLSTDTPGLSSNQAAAAAAEADAAMSAAGLNAVDNPEAAQAALDAAAANVAGYDLGDYGDMASPSRASSAELGALEETGLIGYNDKVALGFLDTIERENRQSDINLARSIADKYGLTPSQVQPGFMQDPSLGPQTMSYRGPGSFNAATSKMATAAGMLGANLVDMTPGLFGLVRGLAGLGRKDSFAGLVGQARGQSRDEQAESLSSKVQGYMDERAASQREANMAARGVTATEEASSIDRSQPQSSTDYFDAPQTLSQQVAAAPQSSVDYFDVPPSQPQSSVDYYDVPTSQQQSSAADLFSDIPDGNEIIPRTVSKTPAAAPTPEPAVEVVRAPVTRTPATDTFGILERIYGPDVAAKLLPTRIV